MFPGKGEKAERKTSRNFASPTRDELSNGRWMVAGDDHGVGYRTPVGNRTAKSYTSGPIPIKSKCENADQAYS